MVLTSLLTMIYMVYIFCLEAAKHQKKSDAMKAFADLPVETLEPEKLREAVKNIVDPVGL